MGHPHPESETIIGILQRAIAEEEERIAILNRPVRLFDLTPTKRLAESLKDYVTMHHVSSMHHWLTRAGLKSKVQRFHKYQQDQINAQKKSEYEAIERKVREELKHLTTVGEIS